ncbi:unnamed protein product [Arctia plantaginis]|uniref:Small ribosomal subunit protein uS5 C-terminal domain-containing protein n=1 Tax=Arctia plantaginis TaxID=874455 RepID=A0A8S0Z8Y0_ARCPL|nr:unnamed protein product [Arctia plantaginis]
MVLVLCLPKFLRSVCRWLECKTVKPLVVGLLAPLETLPCKSARLLNLLAPLETLPCKVTSKCGSVKVILIAAPHGTGCMSAQVPKKCLPMAGVQDCQTSCGSTGTLGNFALQDCWQVWFYHS